MIGFSRTIIEKILVPAEILPVLGATLFVATIPVAASASGAHNGHPACSSPFGSTNFAPVSVRRPAYSPATTTLGKISLTSCV